MRSNFKSCAQSRERGPSYFINCSTEYAPYEYTRVFIRQEKQYSLHHDPYTILHFEFGKEQKSSRFPPSWFVYIYGTKSWSISSILQDTKYKEQKYSRSMPLIEGSRIIRSCIWFSKNNSPHLVKKSCRY
jgi:hypothetical protein